MEFHLYQCRQKIFLATDEQIVSEHINRDRQRKAPVTKMPDGSVVLINNKPYGVNELIDISKRKTKELKLDYSKRLSIIIDDHIIQ